MPITAGVRSCKAPVFIASLSNPEVSFKIFWETERRYDGGVFQYSTDETASWMTLGTVNSNSNCLGVNWYNYDPVNFLGEAGWSGNVQSNSGSCVGGGGSGGWLTAKHSLSIVSGSTKIIFRFVFAAGLTCNNFDGLAIDDIHIGEATPNSADYTYSCNPNNAVTFSSILSGCKTTVAWDFDDVASGVNNSSSLDNPSHTFSAPGSYNVTLTANFVTGPALTSSKTIKIIALAAAVTNPLKCNGDQAGMITATVNPPGTYNYIWNTTPVQNGLVANNLGAGTYTISITGTNTCSISQSVILSEPELLKVETSIIEAKCNAANGSISSVVSGGTGTYVYTWSNAAGTPSINNLAPGIYGLTVRDANGCIANASNLEVKKDTSPLNIFLGKDTVICPDEKLLLRPGNFTSYLWQDNSTASTYTVTSTGAYSVAVTDALGCSGSGNINVTVDCTEIFFPSAFTPNADNRNDEFGPLPYTSLPSLRNYRFTVYGRWGEILFTSTDPYKKWDGSYKGKKLTTQVCTWMATYTLRDLLPVFQKGTVNIIR